MKRKVILSIAFLVFLYSCNKEKGGQEYSLHGNAQKGPFLMGTNVTINELNEKLGQTGRSYNTTIASNDGWFEINNTVLNSSLVQITANGFYFNELYNDLSDAQLSLSAIEDLSTSSVVNINVLTNIIKGRIEFLVNSGKEFSAAKQQAQEEFLNFLGATNVHSNDFSQLTISNNNNIGNAILLASSVIVQRFQRYPHGLEYRPKVAELSQLLSQMSLDFKNDGIINNDAIIDTLLYNLKFLSMNEIRSNIKQRLNSLGVVDSVPDFEKYIYSFQRKYCHDSVSITIYPEKVLPYPDAPSRIPQDTVTNILNLAGDSVFSGDHTYCAISAKIPFNSELTIKFISDSEYILSWEYEPYLLYGWELLNKNPNGFTLKAQNKNEILITGIDFFNHSGTLQNATIEYYENNSIIPNHIKHITW